MANNDTGFVLDETSGLYFHSGSGFYHDPTAGWYYNTHDGVYYTFEEGTYVPILSNDTSGEMVSEERRGDSSPKVATGSMNSVEAAEILPTAQEHGICHVPEDTLETASSLCGTAESERSDELMETLSDRVSDALTETQYPLWHFDIVRSIYWYYDKDSRAYYMYHEESSSNTTETPANDTQSTRATLFQEEHIGTVSEGPRYVTKSERVEHLENQEVGPDEANTEAFEPAPGWVEEALIELYLKGYPQDTSVKDEGPWITSADIFDETPHNVISYANPERLRSSQHGDSRIVEYDDQVLSNSYPLDTEVLQFPMHESDNDGSEELEEGEWVPDEPLRIVDGEHGEDRTSCRENMDENSTDSRFSAGYATNSECYRESGDEKLKAPDLQQGDAPATHRDTDDYDMEEGEINLVDEYLEQKKEEDQWQAQYGQVVREKPLEYVIPGAVDLWDWMIIDKEQKTSKQGKLRKQLVGRIVSSVTKLHPSLSGSSGLIRTSAIKAAELDFVKVSSGKIYKLRRPSRKHLAAVESYDSSNPTKDLGLPLIGLAAQNIAEERESIDVNVAHNEITGCGDCLVSKPFIPNTGHWRFQGLLPTKKGRGVAGAHVASKYLSPEEIVIREQRKQRYRDRAAERRNLHGGFGIGPGQKGLSVIELEKLDVDEATGMAGALEKAAAAPPLGRENVGKRMLEGMGWKEGETLGVEGGLVRPLQAQGNVGRAGLGWG